MQDSETSVQANASAETSVEAAFAEELVRAYLVLAIQVSSALKDPERVPGRHSLPY